MFQFPGFASSSYEFRTGYPRKGGFPHSDIRGSTIARISPRLFAACHVLHRLLVPRHPPNALICLILVSPRKRPTLARAPFVFHMQRQARSERTGATSNSHQDTTTAPASPDRPKSPSVSTRTIDVPSSRFHTTPAPLGTDYRTWSSQVPIRNNMIYRRIRRACPASSAPAGRRLPAGPTPGGGGRD